MQTVTLSEGDKPYTVTACVVLCGKDIAVVIGGGETSHIGAAALASPRPSLKNTAEISASASHAFQNSSHVRGSTTFPFGVPVSVIPACRNSDALYQ